MKNVIANFMLVAPKKSNTSATDVNQLCRKSVKIMVIVKFLPFPICLNNANLEPNEDKKGVELDKWILTPIKHGIFLMHYVCNI